MADTNIVALVTQVAQSLGVDPKLAVAIMLQESGGNPDAIGDNGHSVGLFQLNDQGEGAGMTVQAREDPATNATIALREVAAVAQAHPDWSPGQIAAAAQRPADQTAYAASVNALYNGQAATLAEGYDHGSGGVVSDTGIGSQGQVLSMSDIPALDQYIRDNYGMEAWLLDVPQVKQVLEEAVVSGKANSTAAIQALISQTPWWQQTSQAVKNFQEAKANNPADYDFKAPGSTAQQTFYQVQSQASQLGVALDDTQAANIAWNAMQYGWNSQEIAQAISQNLAYGGPQATNAPGAVQTLQTIAAQYMIPLSDQSLQDWAQKIAAGQATTQTFQGWMSSHATAKWAGMAQQIQEGLTPQQIVDPMKQEAAKVMEVNPDQIDFMNDPTYAKMLDYVPPGETQHRLMTTSEEDQYLKSLPQWGKTQQARDQAAQLEQTILQTWGKVGAAS